MLISKIKHVVEVKDGVGEVLTKNIVGVIEHLLVMPVEGVAAIFNFSIIDGDGDEILSIKRANRKINYKEKLFIPTGSFNFLKLRISNSDFCGKFKIIFFIKEK